MKWLGMERKHIFAMAFFLVSAYAISTPNTTHAATLYIDPTEVHAYRADSVSLAVRINTDENECVNTVDAVVHYDENIAAVDVSRGDSILSLWVEAPKIDPVAHTITFAGGVPNGYCGRVAGDPRLTNVVANLIFQVPGFAVGGGTSTVANITFDPLTRVLLNDGLGTEAPLRTLGAKINLDTKPGNTITDTWAAAVADDKVPPAPFSIELVKNDAVFNGKYYIVFSTTDKQSGLDHYEVYEEPLKEVSLFKWGAPNRSWVVAKNPYVLVDQGLKSIIRVKAVDKAGNERIATLAPASTARLIDPYSNILLIVIGAVGVIVIMLLSFIVKRKLARKKALLTTVNEEPHD